MLSEKTNNIANNSNRKPSPTIQSKDYLNPRLNWIDKYSKAIEKHSTKHVHNAVLDVIPSYLADENKIIDFERNSIIKLDMLVPEIAKRKIFIECSCVYPVAKLEAIRKAYSETKDIKVAHSMLQKQFEKDIANEPLKNEIVEQHMGPAGIIENDKIIITVMPKEPESYFSSSDSVNKRYHYCSCDRVRSQILENKQTFSEDYCYCGAGYYKKIWEYILNKEVNVSIIETALKGSDVCRFIIN